MSDFERRNPAILLIYFLSAILLTMFIMNPLISLISLSGALSFWFTRNGLKDMKYHLYALIILVISAVINPLVSHNGVTVLFVLNNNPVTLEAFYYGLTMGITILSVLYWMRSFTQIMTTDKILCIFGKISPKLSLLLSSALRFVPLFAARAAETESACKAAGLSNNENTLSRVRGSARTFSSVVTWGLENGIITADSMSARGYGTVRRTSFSLFRFGKRDAVFLAVTVLLLTAPVCSAAVGSLNFVFYPSVSLSKPSGSELAAYISYSVLSFLPTIIEVKENIKWKYLQSKICPSNIPSAFKTR